MTGIVFDSNAAGAIGSALGTAPHEQSSKCTYIYTVLILSRFKHLGLIERFVCWTLQEVLVEPKLPHDHRESQMRISSNEYIHFTYQNDLEKNCSCYFYWNWGCL